MANTILKWNDDNNGATGFKIRKGGGPLTDPLAHPLVATVGPDVREYRAPVGANQEYWAVSVYDASQEVVTLDQAMCYPGKIVPTWDITAILQGVAFATDYGPFTPDTLERYTVAGNDGNVLSAAAMVTTVEGVTYSITSDNIYKWDTSKDELSVALEIAQPSQTGMIRWAVAIPSGLIVYACSRGYVSYDPKTKAFVLEIAQTSDIAQRGSYSSVLNKIVLAGGLTSQGLDKLVIGFMSLDTWEVTFSVINGVTGGHASTGGTLLINQLEAIYWPSGTIPFLGVITWDADGANLTPSKVAAPNHPILGYQSQGIPSGSIEHILISNGNYYRVTPTEVTTGTLTALLGAAATPFTASCAAMIRTPDGGYIVVGSGMAEVLYFDHNFENAKIMQNGNTGGLQFALYANGTVHCLAQGSSPAVRLTWTGGKKPNIVWPTSWLASQYNCQGRTPT